MPGYNADQKRKKKKKGEREREKKKDALVVEICKLFSFFCGLAGMLSSHLSD